MLDNLTIRKNYKANVAKARIRRLDNEKFETEAMQ